MAKLWAAILISVLAISEPSPATGDCFPAESPSDFCASARVIPGSPGRYEVVMNVGSATGVESHCSVPVGHTVWFDVTPTTGGIITFSTCHPATTYDTVVEVYKGSDSECEFITPVTCIDDTPRFECSNGCNAYSSIATFMGEAGQRYRIVVGSYNNNSAGCELCLGVTVSICDPNDIAPPTVSMTSPAPLACVCGVAPITGSVLGSLGDLRSYWLEYAPASGGPWVLLIGGTSEVNNDVLTNWDTSFVPSEGYHLLRLTANDVCGNVASATAVVWVDKSMNTVRLDAPSSGQVVGGAVCGDGSAWDNCPPGSLILEHRPVGGVFQRFDSIMPPWILNNPLGSWNTAGSVPDGNYEVRLTGQDACGHVSEDSAMVTVDNTIPIASIGFPLSCTSVDGSVQIRGTAADPHLGAWQLMYGGGDTNGWVEIGSGNTSVTDGLLGTWNTAGLPRCPYALRLVVTDTAILNCNAAVHNQNEDIVVVMVGDNCDINDDGYLDGLDVQPFVNCLLNLP